MRADVSRRGRGRGQGGGGAGAGSQGGWWGSVGVVGGMDVRGRAGGEGGRGWEGVCSRSSWMDGWQER